MPNQTQTHENPNTTHTVTGKPFEHRVYNLQTKGGAGEDENVNIDTVRHYEKSYLYLYTEIDPNKMCKELVKKTRQNSVCFAQVMSTIHSGPVTNGFCTYHDYILHNRKYIYTKSNGVKAVLPVGVKSISPKTIKSIGMLFSFFTSNDNEIYQQLLTNNEAYTLTDNVNKVENEIKNICKAMSVLLDERQYNKPEYNQLMTTYKMWAQSNNDLMYLENWNKMHFLMEVDKAYYANLTRYERFTTQNWFANADLVNDADVYILFVPFTFLCDFDKIRLASFLPSMLMEECRIPNKYSIGYIPNITFYNGIIQMGGGGGIMYDCPQQEEGFYHRFSELIAAVVAPTFEVSTQVTGFEANPITCKEPKIGELERELNKPNIVTKYIQHV